MIAKDIDNINKIADIHNIKNYNKDKVLYNVCKLNKILNDVVEHKLYGKELKQIYKDNNEFYHFIMSISKDDVTLLYNKMNDICDNNNNNNNNKCYKLVKFADNKLIQVGGGKKMDILQMILSIVGMVPVVGEPSDIISGIISIVYEKDYLGGMLSFASIIPIIGMLPGALKIIRILFKLMK
jgi:hypothetical protein